MMRRRRPGRGLEEEVAGRIGARAGETLVVACSGGPDSVALAALAARACTRAGARLVLAHVNHGVRPEAGRDEAVSLSIGAALGVRVAVVGLPLGDAAEARLRDLRYLALARIARDTTAARVLTAHHAADQTESVLLALFRGAGLAGLGGIAPIRPLGPGLSLERPLLGVDPARLRAHCLREHLPYAVDASNDDAGYRRVAVRRALAGLRASFPGLDEAVARHATLVRDARDPGVLTAAREALRDGIAAATGDVRELTSERLDLVARAVTEGRDGRYFLRRGVELVVTSTAAASHSKERT